MPIIYRFLKNRLALAVGIFALLCGLVLLGRWTTALRSAPTGTSGAINIVVTNDADRGPGSLREALFTADAAGGKAQVSVRSRKIALTTPLPALVNRRGIRIVGDPVGAEIDARSLKAGAVFDVDADNVTIAGLVISHCPAAAVLLRARFFKLESTTVVMCDVGLDVAENASDIVVAHNRFENNRLGVRFAVSNRNAIISKNRFSANQGAGVWAVRSSLDVADAGAISVQENSFNDDSIGIVAGNVSVAVERNVFTGAHSASIHLIGAGAVVRANHVAGGAATGIVVEDARAAIVEDNEIDHVTGYGVLVRRSGKSLIQNNRIHDCGYGLAFVLGDSVNPSTALNNLFINQQYDAIDVVGDSPILRGNRIFQIKGRPLHIEDYRSPGGQMLHAHPLVEGNSITNTDVKSAAGAVTVAKQLVPASAAPASR